MRALCYTCPGTHLYNLKQPETIYPDDVLVRIAYAGICGSDINIMNGHEDDFLKIKKGDCYILGHEAAGYVAELGPKATAKGLKKGDKVALYYNQHCGKCYYCRNGQEQFCSNMQSRGGFFADYAVVNEQQVFKLPDDTDMREAALIEPISVVQRGIDLLGLRPGMKVAVTGGGGIGMLFVQLLRLAGAARLTVIEPVEEKREMALKMGADYVIDPKKEDVSARSLEITDGMGFDVVVESSGVVPVIQTAYEILGRGGTLELFACYGKQAAYSLDLASFFTKEVKIVGVFQSPYMYPRALELFQRIDKKPFIRHIFKPEDWEKALEVRKTGVPQKVMFDFTDGGKA